MNPIKSLKKRQKMNRRNNFMKGFFCFSEYLSNNKAFKKLGTRFKIRTRNHYRLTMEHNGLMDF